MDYRIFNVRTYVNACDCTWGYTIRGSALKVDSGRKIPCCARESNLCRQHASPTLYQPSYFPTPGQFCFNSLALGTIQINCKMKVAHPRIVSGWHIKQHTSGTDTGLGDSLSLSLWLSLSLSVSPSPSLIFLLSEASEAHMINTCFPHGILLLRPSRHYLWHEDGACKKTPARIWCSGPASHRSNIWWGI